MTSDTITPAPVLDRASADLVLMARVSGVLYACGALLVALSLVLPHPDSAEAIPLFVIVGMALVCGVALYRFPGLVRVWMIHVSLASSAALVSASVYFSGVAAGVYSVMFVWTVIVAACIATRPGLALHVGWIMVTHGAALIALEEQSTGFSLITRFVLTGFALGAAGAAVSWLVEGRRHAEAGLHREIETREKLQRELEHLANHDPLTGVANRRRLEEHLASVLVEADRSGAPLCLIALDLDGFKEFNDEHGHAAGDRLLKAAASGWDSVLRNGDVITRMGGDEFLVVLPNCPIDVSTRIVDRLRAAVPSGQSCSTGISYWNGTDAADDFLLAADKALYRTKEARSVTLAG